jgi:hypothetical protein
MVLLERYGGSQVGGEGSGELHLDFCGAQSRKARATQVHRLFGAK